MAQCQTNPNGQCTMEPPCPVGECYLYAVISQEHADPKGSVIEDLGPAAALLDGELLYNRGPYTELQAWGRTRLDLVNAVLDTLVPGTRLMITTDETGKPTRVALGCGHVYDRPRDVVASLRQIADCLDPAKSVR